MIVDQALYVDGKRSEEEFVLEGPRHSCRDPNVFAWIGLYEPTEEEFAAVAAEFDLHELAVEDGQHGHQRPKLEIFDDTLLVVLKTARYVDTDEVVEFGEIALYLSREFVVAVRHGPATGLAGVRKRVEDRPDLLALGPGAVLYGILDKVVDDYLPVMDGLDNDIQEVEQEVFSAVGGGDNPAERIYYLKREVLEFDRAAHPLLEPLEQLARGDRFEQLPETLNSYFRDVADHLTRVVEQITQYRDLLTSILEANLTRVGVRQNNDMRRITAWVAIVAVPTMLAGIWGMNFGFMPELNSPWGYPVALLVMALASFLIYRRLKKSGWL